MGQTPLYDALRAFASQNPLRLHIPGHKGRPLPLPELSAAAALDFTELPATGNLFTGEGPIRAAERLWAKTFGMEECLFLTGGSTQGILAALTLATMEAASVPRPSFFRPSSGAAPPTDTIKRPPSLLLDRSCHRSVYNALALLDLQPVYLDRPWLDRAGVLGPVCLKTVEEQLAQNPSIHTVCITSPTYYGLLSDIPALALLAHAHGALLLVDAAHGAHLPFLGNLEVSAADLVVTSAHKTLPALGQSSLLFAGGTTSFGFPSPMNAPQTNFCSGNAKRFSHSALCQAASVYGSSSPSYLLMASLDTARAFMEDAGRGAYEKTVDQVAQLRAMYASLSPTDAPLDPARLVLRSADGFALQSRLEKLGVFPEMADKGHVVFILTCADQLSDFARLHTCLAQTMTSTPLSAFPLPCPPQPTPVCSPREAWLSCKETLPLCRAQGRTCASLVAPYPPGVPVLAPGEYIEKKHLAYLDEIGYNMEQDLAVMALSRYP